METKLESNRNLYVVYASDDKFAEILGVSLTSLYENNKGMDQIVVYILDSGIVDENKRKIETISQTYGREEVQWIAAKDISRELQIEISIDRGSLSQYARLFLSSLLPEYLEKILYLDCDTIIEQPLEELWNIDMHGKTVAALMDAFSKWYRRNIELQPEDIMFNSGVMLIDMKRWKELDIEYKLLKFIQRHKGQIQQGDQGALNAVLSHDVYCLDPKFNAVTIFYDFSYKEMLIYRKPPGYYTEQQVKNAVANPVIIHFTTSFLSRRPWKEGCDHQYTSEWIKYKRMSPWCDEELQGYEKPRGLNGIYTRIALFLPRKVNIYLSGILQAYGRPLMYRIKNKKAKI